MSSFRMKARAKLVEMRWGLVPFWVVQALEGIAARHVQRPRRDRGRQAVLPGAVQEATVLDARLRLLRVGRHAGRQQPHYFTARDGSPVLTIAGLWDEWKNRETGERIKSCTMIITEPNEFVAEAHDRMPVLLQPDQFDHWLSGNMTVEELKPAPNDYLQRWAVSKRVNSSKADKDDANTHRAGEAGRLIEVDIHSMIHVSLTTLLRRECIIDGGVS